eukprot:2322411-Amphidinium_carterae.1
MTQNCAHAVITTCDPKIEPGRGRFKWCGGSIPLNPHLNVRVGAALPPKQVMAANHGCGLGGRSLGQEVGMARIPASSFPLRRVALWH